MLKLCHLLCTDSRSMQKYISFPILLLSTSKLGICCWIYHLKCFTYGKYAVNRKSEGLNTYNLRQEVLRLLLKSDMRGLKELKLIFSTFDALRNRQHYKCSLTNTQHLTLNVRVTRPKIKILKQAYLTNFITTYLTNISKHHNKF